MPRPLNLPTTIILEADTNSVAFLEFFLKGGLDSVPNMFRILNCTTRRQCVHRSWKGCKVLN